MRLNCSEIYVIVTKRRNFVTIQITIPFSCMQAVKCIGKYSVEERDVVKEEVSCGLWSWSVLGTFFYYQERVWYVCNDLLSQR